MGDLTFYLKIGWEHIISWQAIDHLLFILALAAIYLPQNRKQVLVLVTAFTIGHSLTLALSVYNLVSINSKWVEFIIPCTIMITAVFNLLQKSFSNRSLRLNYLLALFFGLVHGLGFAATIRFMLAGRQTIFIPLLGFNIGLELGQVVVMAVILALAYIVVIKLHLRRQWWVWILSIAAFAWAAYFAIQRLP
jgi:HupE / UreJ protein